MKPSKKQLPEYLSFTRKERTGIIVLFVLILLFTTLPFLFPFFIDSKPVDHAAFEKEIAELKLQEADNNKGFTKRDGAVAGYDDDHESRPAEKKYPFNEPGGALFYFDPNTLSAAGWVKLGVKEKTATTIQNYLSKGGRFYKPEDIGKIWGLRQDQVNRLLPYVRIATKPSPGFSTSKTALPYKDPERARYAIQPVDINEADTTAFIDLPGIGNKLANRIIAFREKLGGFYKVEQVAETFALPDSTFQKIKDKLMISNNRVKQININTATLEELKVHPYLRYPIANAIVQYRTLHGDFSTVGDLQKIMIITDDIFNRVAPYLTNR